MEGRRRSGIAIDSDWIYIVLTLHATISRNTRTYAVVLYY